MPNQKGFIKTGLIILVLAVLLITAIIASRSAHEGQFLYPLKQAGDKIELALASGHEAKAKIRFKLLERHILEMKIATVKGDYGEVVDESHNFINGVEEINHDIAEITQTGKSADSIRSRLQSNVNDAVAALTDAASKSSGKDQELINQELEKVKQLKF